MRETPKARHALAAYLDLGPERSLPKLAAAMQRRPGYVRQLQKWSALWGWQERAERHDHARLMEDLGNRAAARERVIQRFVDHGQRAADTWIAVTSGRIPHGCDMVPILDRHGKAVMVERELPDGSKKSVHAMRPLIPPSVQGQSAQAMLGVLGIVPPKRVELMGPDKSALDLAGKVVGRLPDDALDLIAAMLGGDDDGHTG